MSIFAKQKMEEICGEQQVFEKLIINDVCWLDLFEENITSDKQLLSEYKTILAYMNLLANGLKLPLTKFKEIKGGSMLCKRFEFKSKHLRVYALDEYREQIIILGGFKSTQKADINRLNAIAKEYINSL